MWSVFKRKGAAEAAARSAPAPLPGETAGTPGSAPPTTTDTAAAPPNARPLSGIAYDPGLVDKLKGDHAELVRLHRALYGAVISRRFDSIPQGLVEFRRALQTHLLVENVRFYIYVEKLLAANPDELAYVRSLKQEMNAIARTIGTFIETWSSEPPHAETAAAFLEQLDAIGKDFTQRIELEETTLYTLYVASL